MYNGEYKGNETMTTQLYHYTLGFPKDIQAILTQAKRTQFELTLTYSAHAKKESAKDRYLDKINLPNSINCNKCIPIEIETQNGIFHKVVYRTSYNKVFDICYVILVANSLVKTIWLNRKTDKHRTLNESKYTILTESEVH